MGGSNAKRTVMVAGGALAAAAFAVSSFAQEGPPVPLNFTDPNQILDHSPTVDLAVRDDAASRFNALSSAPDASAEATAPRSLELELAAGGGSAPLDISVAQRASFGTDNNGDIDRSGRGSEVRIGRGLVQARESRDSGSSVYMFVASDDEALTWQPGSRSEFGGRGPSLTMQDQVQVGDLSAGVTYESNGVQASLAYVQREESTRVGQQSFTQEEEFAGVTITMRN